MLIQGSSDPPRLVRVGIDAAIVAQHEVSIRATDVQGRVRTDRFRVQPTLAGLRSLSNPGGSACGPAAWGDHR